MSVLKDELDQTIPLGETLACSQILSNIPLQSVIEINDLVPNPKDVAISDTNKLHGERVSSKSIKKAKINNKLSRIHMFAKRRKVKIKGLKVVNKKGDAADHVEDSSDDVQVAMFNILLIMFLIFYIYDLFL